MFQVSMQVGVKVSSYGVLKTLLVMEWEERQREKEMGRNIFST